MLADWYRSRHDKLIGWAAAFVALGSVGSAVILAVAIPWAELFDDTWPVVAVLLGIASGVVQGGAFAYFASGFLEDRSRRRQRLRLGAVVLALAYLLGLAGVAISLATEQFATLSDEALVRLAMAAASMVLGALAAALVASAFAARDSVDAAVAVVARNRSLGWALVLEALSIALSTAAPVVASSRLVLGWADVPMASETAGFASDALTFLVALLAAVGFFVFVSARRRRPEDSRLLRETWLVRAAGVLVVAAVLDLVAAGLQGWEFWRDGWLWGGSARVWEGLVISVCLTVAAILLAAAFGTSRRQAFVARWLPPGRPPTPGE